MLADEKFIQGAYIQEGTSPQPGVIVVCATVGDDDENPESRLGVRRNQGWIEFAIDGFAGLSIDADSSGSAFALAESGAIVKFDWAAKNQTSLEDSAALIENPRVDDEGPLRRIRILGKDVITAGSVGQVYVLVDDQFVQLPRLMIDDEAPTIEDLAGSSQSDIVAVTSDGYVAHFDGSQWTILDIPSNASFTSICVTRTGQYAISGKNGTILIGALSGWAVIPGLDDDVDYWGIAVHDMRIYAASQDGIDEITPLGATPVPIHNDSLDFAVLRSCQDGVWSFANRTVGYVAGGAWITVLS